MKIHEVAPDGFDFSKVAYAGFEFDISDVEFILEKFAKDEYHEETIESSRDLTRVHQQTSLLITERLEKA